MSLLAPLDPAVAAAQILLRHCESALNPVLGPASVAVSLVLLTLLVRLCLLPLSVRVARAEKARRALAPTLDRLRRRHSGDRARLVRELQAAHREAGVSPVAGLGPALAQAPFLMVIYRLCSAPMIAGATSLVQSANLLGVPLAQHGLAIVAGAGLFSVPAAVFAVMLAAMTAVAAWSSAVAVSRIREASAAAAPGQAVSLVLARILPFGTVAAAMAVPFAVSLYLLTSTTWAVTERVVLPRLI